MIRDTGLIFIGFINHCLFERFINNPESEIRVQSTSLRIIEYFTNSSVYQQNEALSLLIFNHLIKNGKQTFFK